MTGPPSHCFLTEHHWISYSWFVITRPLILNAIRSRNKDRPTKSDLTAPPCILPISGRREEWQGWDVTFFRSVFLARTVGVSNPSMFTVFLSYFDSLSAPYQSTRAQFKFTLYIWIDVHGTLTFGTGLLLLHYEDTGNNKRIESQPEMIITLTSITPQTKTCDSHARIDT